MNELRGCCHATHSIRGKRTLRFSTTTPPCFARPVLYNSAPQCHRGAVVGAKGARCFAWLAPCACRAWPAASRGICRRMRRKRGNCYRSWRLTGGILLKRGSCYLSCGNSADDRACEVAVTAHGGKSAEFYSREVTVTVHGGESADYSSCAVTVTSPKLI